VEGTVNKKMAFIKMFNFQFKSNYYLEKGLVKKKTFFFLIFVNKEEVYSLLKAYFLYFFLSKTYLLNMFLYRKGLQCLKSEENGNFLRHYTFKKRNILLEKFNVGEVKLVLDFFVKKDKLFRLYKEPLVHSNVSFCNFNTSEKNNIDMWCIFLVRGLNCLVFLTFLFYSIRSVTFLKSQTFLFFLSSLQKRNLQKKFLFSIFFEFFVLFIKQYKEHSQLYSLIRFYVGYTPEINYIANSLLLNSQLTLNEIDGYMRSFWLNKLNKSLIFRLQRHYPFGDFINPVVDFGHKEEGAAMTLEKWLELFFGFIMEEDMHPTAASQDVMLDSIETGLDVDEIREVKVRLLIFLASFRFQRRFYYKRKRKKKLRKLFTHRSPFLGAPGRSFREALNAVNAFHGTTFHSKNTSLLFEKNEPAVLSSKIISKAAVNDSYKKKIIISNNMYIRNFNKLKFYAKYWYMNPYYFFFVIKNLNAMSMLKNKVDVSVLTSSKEQEFLFSLENYSTDFDLLALGVNILERISLHNIPFFPSGQFVRLFSTIQTIPGAYSTFVLDKSYNIATRNSVYLTLSTFYERNIFQLFSDYVKNEVIRKEKQFLIDYYNGSSLGSFEYHSKIFKEVLGFIWYKKYVEFLYVFWLQNFIEIYLPFSDEKLKLYMKNGMQSSFFFKKTSPFDIHFNSYTEAVPFPPWKPRIRHKTKGNPKPRYAWLKFKPIFGVWLPFVYNAFFFGRLEQARRELYNPLNILKIKYDYKLSAREKSIFSQHINVLERYYNHTGAPNKFFEDMIVRYPKMSYIESVLGKILYFFKGYRSKIAVRFWFAVFDKTFFKVFGIYIYWFFKTVYVL
jgi:hypothetical protein